MLKESDIYAKLGLRNKSDILNSQQIKDIYDLQWNTTEVELDNRFDLENKNKIKGYFFDVIPLKKYDLNKKISQTFTKIAKLNVRKGWAISLPNNKTEIEVPSCDQIARFSNELYCIDNGHLLAHEFKKYICSNGYTRFFNKSNKEPSVNNIIPEFDTTNRSLHLDEQSRFEKYVIDIVEDILQRNLKDKVYYEAEAIYYEKDDCIPIGIRLFACTYEIKENKDVDVGEKLFHVFLPNFHIDSENEKLVDKIKKGYQLADSLSDREAYRKFFQEYKKS